MAELGDLFKAAAPGTVGTKRILPRLWSRGAMNGEGHHALCRQAGTTCSTPGSVSHPVPQGRRSLAGQHEPPWQLGDCSSLSAAPPSSSPKTRKISGKSERSPGGVWCAFAGRCLAARVNDTKATMVHPYPRVPTKQISHTQGVLKLKGCSEPRGDLDQQRVEGTGRRRTGSDGLDPGFV